MYLSHLPRDAKITFDQFHIPRYSGVQGNTREKLKLCFYFVKLFRGLAFLLMLLMLSVHSHAFLSRGGGAPYSGLHVHGEAPPKRGAFCKLAVYRRVEKIAILVYERATKSAAKWKK